MMDLTSSNGVLEPSLDEVTRGAPRLEDELLAERIETAGLAWLRRGHVPSLADLLSSMPILRSRPISLDAAIDVALRGQLARGRSLDDATAELLRDAPELEDEVEAHLAMRSMLGSLPASTSGPAPAAEDLPRPFGPPLKDGRHRYQLEELVGSGSEGMVFRAMDRQLSADGRPLQVAIKMLHPWRDGLERSVSDEAARATRVRHASIAALLDFGSWENQPYLVHDFIDGIALDRWRSRQTAIDSRAAAALVQQLAEAVQTAHNAGVVHRDLKPTNILIDKGGAPHITDFGLAAAMTRTAGAAEAVGSLGFAAPEQLRADPGCEDAAVDVYALGGLLYWLLTGSFPNGATPEEVRERIHEWEEPGAPDPQRVRAGLDPTLAAICRKSLAPLPRDRYASAAVLAIDLERWLDNEPVSSIDTAPTRRLRLWIRRSPPRAAGVSAAILLILLALGVAWRADLERRQAGLEKELELIRLREQDQQERIKDASSLIQSIVGAMESLQADAADFSWLPIVSAIDAITGDHGLGVTELNLDLNSTRIAVAENILNAADTAGARDSVEMVMWETTLGFWLLKSDRAAEARPVLEANLVRARRVLPEGDPWTAGIATLNDVALVMTEPGANAEARARLAAAVDTLSPNLQKLVQDTLAPPTPATTAPDQ